jgi:hypothetical protein
MERNADSCCFIDSMALLYFEKRQVGWMIRKGIWLNKAKKAMSDTGIECISDLSVGWSTKNKILIVIDDKKSFYEVYGLKVVYSEETVQKVSAVEKAHNQAELLNAIRVVESKAASEKVEGIPVRDPHACIECLFTVTEGIGKKAKPIELPAVFFEKHDYGSVIGYICDQNLQVTENPIFLSENMLLHHVIVTGSTGGGKTEVAKRIVTEMQKTGKKILVVTPEPHLWASLENSNVITDVLDLSNVINILDFSSVTDLAEVSSLVLETILDHYGKMEQTSNLRLLLVVDEAHIFLGNKDHEAILERATRSLRKFGVSCVLISHTYADFNRGIRANIQTHIAMYTNWARDLSYIKAFQPEDGIDYSKLLLQMPEGYGIFRSREFMRNQPLPCRFLRANETLQPYEMKQNSKLSVEDVTQRRMAILQVIREIPRISAEGIGLELENKGVRIEDSKIYRDLEWLEGQKLIAVSEVRERGKKHYKAV